MKALVSLLLLCVVAIFGEPYQADEFLLSGWAAASGMGGLRIIRHWDGLSAAANPALLTEIHGSSVAASGGSFFESLVTAARAGGVIGEGQMKYGLVVSHIGGDGIFLTELVNPDQPLSADNRPHITGEASHYTAAMDIAAARMWGKTSIGASVKAVRKKIPDVAAWGFALSAGALWKPMQGLETATFIENISTYQLFWSDGVRETGLPRIGAGASYNFDVSSAIRLSVAAEGDYSPDDGIGILRAGASGTYADVLTFALGTADGSLCTGAALKIGQFTLGASLDYRAATGKSYSFSFGYSP